MQEMQSISTRNEATEIPVRGDCRSLFELQESARRADAWRATVAPLRVNEELTRALKIPGRPDLEHLLHEDEARVAAGPVRFLPVDRLMSAEEKAGALEGFREVLASGDFTSGAQIDRFEAELGAFLGRSVIATSSGTDGMMIALAALGVGPGDEVIMPANSFVATENAVFALGATPVLVDSDPRDLNIDPTQIAEKITARTKAIFAVDLYGKAADMEAIRAIAAAHGLKVILDACQSIGVMDSLERADVAVYSLNPYKNFGVCGKGGAIAAADPALAERCRSISYHGYVPGTKTFKANPFGYNARIDNTQAAIALRRLPHLTLNNLRRMLLARRYIEALRPLEDAGKLALPAFTDDRAYHLFTVQITADLGRDEVRQRMLARREVEAAIYYPVLTHRQPTELHRRLFAGVSLPQVEAAHARILSLPLYNTLSVAAQDRVVEALHDALA